MSSPTLLLSMPGPTELLVILAVVLIFFGNKIPGVARSLGAGVNEFKAGLREGDKPAGEGKSSGDDQDPDGGKDRADKRP